MAVVHYFTGTCYHIHSQVLWFIGIPTELFSFPPEWSTQPSGLWNHTASWSSLHLRHSGHGPAIVWYIVSFVPVLAWQWSLWDSSRNIIIILFPEMVMRLVFNFPLHPLTVWWCCCCNFRTRVFDLWVYLRLYHAGCQGGDVLVNLGHDLVELWPLPLLLEAGVTRAVYVQQLSQNRSHRSRGRPRSSLQQQRNDWLVKRIS